MTIAAMALAGLAGLTYALGLVLYLVRRAPSYARRGTLIVAIGLVLHTASIALFWRAFGQPPWATACGVLALWSWMAVVVLLVLASRRGMQVVGVLIVPVVLMMFAAAFVVPKRPFVLPGGGPPLMAAHIPLVFLSYTAFLYAAVSAALYLAQDARMKRKGPSAYFERIPPLEWLERFMAGSLIAGFCVLTVGLALGVAWLSASRPGGGFHDPKIAATGIIWLLYAALVAARLLAWGRGRRVAVMAIVCFVLALASFVFVRHGVLNSEAEGATTRAGQETATP
jgi:ABC-type uncharacterized transport system permease subunit